jgi:hypothetical protein
VTSIRCWLCGIEPRDMITFSNWNGCRWSEPDWPYSEDHEHAERPPTPAELVAAGQRILDRIRTEI